MNLAEGSKTVEPCLLWAIKIAAYTRILVDIVKTISGAKILGRLYKSENEFNN